MVCLAALTVSAIIGVSAVLSKSRMMDDRVQQMKAAVDLLHGLAQTSRETAPRKEEPGRPKPPFPPRAPNKKVGGGPSQPLLQKSENANLGQGPQSPPQSKNHGPQGLKGVFDCGSPPKPAKQTSPGGVPFYLYPRPARTKPSPKTFSSPGSTP